jgi:hypothetical protein
LQKSELSDDVDEDSSSERRSEHESGDDHISFRVEPDDVYVRTYGNQMLAISVSK